MANEQIAVELRIKTKQLANDLRQSKAETAALKKSFVEVGNTGAKVEAQMAKMGRSSAQATKSLASMATVLRAVAVYSAGQAIFGSLKTWSEYVSKIQAANNQLKSVSESSADFARTQQITLQVANETGTAYEETAKTLARVKRAMEEMGGTTDQAAIITDSLNKALMLTGATGAEATSTLGQFGQALQSTTLQGDELKSLRENAPLIIKAIAEELGITVGEIKKAGEQGRITAEVTARAVIKANKELTREAAKLPLTLERALQVASNNISVFLANNEGLANFTSQLASGIVELADLFMHIGNDVSNTDYEFNEFTQTVLGLKNPLDLIGTAIGGVIKGFYTFGKAVKLAADIVFNVFKVMYDTIKAFVVGAIDQLKAVGDVLIGVFTFDTARIERGLNANLNGAQKMWDALQKAGKDSLDATEKDMREFGEGVVDAFLGPIKTAQKTALDAGGDFSGPKGPKTGTGTDNNAKKATDEYKKALDELQSAYNSMLGPARQAWVEMDTLNKKIETFRAVAKPEHIGLLDDLKQMAKAKYEDTLADINRQWEDMSKYLSVTEAEARDTTRALEDIERTGKLFEKTAEEIEAAKDAYLAFKDAIADEELQTRFEAIAKGLGDMVGGALGSIITQAQTAEEALRSMIAQLLEAIVQAAILSAFGQGSFGSNLGNIIGGLSPKSSGPTIRIYNQNPGGIVSTSRNANGDTDIIIGQLSASISKGGNQFDTMLRRTYGLRRQGV